MNSITGSRHNCEQGQPKPQLGRCLAHHNKETTGAGRGRAPPAPPHSRGGGGGGGYQGVGGEGGVAALHLLYIYIYILFYMWARGYLPPHILAFSPLHRGSTETENRNFYGAEEVFFQQAFEESQFLWPTVSCR